VVVSAFCALAFTSLNQEWGEEKDCSAIEKRAKAKKGRLGLYVEGSLLTDGSQRQEVAQESQRIGIF